MARIQQIVEALNWELFCEKRPSADEELAREFYENLTPNESTTVSIRGTKAPITSNAINKFFELPDFKYDEYSSLMRNIETENLQEILEKLTILSSKWTMSKQGIHTYHSEYLTPLAKDSITSPRSLRSAIQVDGHNATYAVASTSLLEIFKNMG
ncbi:hypothetical protein PVK06_024571 [Gossypium arboreum]|uniref:Putative plant transposon protein domain-containing protein n=1 Tax=Gossypium arboreum TaxID=29729 RepID=A0ABR0PE35_GOSAR|nr:hypothetical protein PVK06_024571 [Gossypium arboreum]